MAKMVCRHLSRKYVLQDENYLEQIIDSHEKCMISILVWCISILVWCISILVWYISILVWYISILVSFISLLLVHQFRLLVYYQYTSFVYQFTSLVYQYTGFVYQFTSIVYQYTSLVYQIILVYQLVYQYTSFVYQFTSSYYLIIVANNRRGNPPSPLSKGKKGTLEKKHSEFVSIALVLSHLHWTLSSVALPPPLSLSSFSSLSPPPSLSLLSLPSPISSSSLQRVQVVPFLLHQQQTHLVQVTISPLYTFVCIQIQ